MTQVKNQTEIENCEEIISLKEKIAELEDKFLRVMAESENLRKRIEKEKKDGIEYCVASFARDVLAIRDNLKLALSSCSAESSPIIDGIKMTLTATNQMLGKHGIRVIEALHKNFDPNLHQAVIETEDDSHESGVIVEIMQDGFMLHERLLRPAMVGVTKARSKKE
jgi:molecular chaperone GrpE